ncbi:MAG: hypothetical protein H7X80_07815 [bacterium]|nr:hypothetical protein [Candidatus Kapabacteria bacterium]
MSVRSIITLCSALVISLAAMSCTDEPTSPNKLARGAFAGVNTGLLSTLITNTTEFGGDTASGVVVAASIRGNKLSGIDSAQMYYRYLGLFSIDGMASKIDSVTANQQPLTFLPNSPPAHYELEATLAISLDSTSPRTVLWRTIWPGGIDVTGKATPPRGFGTVTLSVGKQLSVAALDAGQAITIRWTDTVPKTKVFIYVSWQPKTAAPTLVVPPKALLVKEDGGLFPIPGGSLSELVKQPDGRLTFVLYRGRYETIASFDNGTKTLGAFSYASDSTYVELIP